MAKAKTKKGKRQGELSGLERPTIEELDELCGEVIEAEEQVAAWGEKRSQRNAALELKMREHRGKLEKDIHEQPIYTFVDGEESETFVLAKNERLRHRKKKKGKADGGEAEGGGEIE